jgi:hypothetical protein
VIEQAAQAKGVALEMVAISADGLFDAKPETPCSTLSLR